MANLNKQQIIEGLKEIKNQYGNDNGFTTAYEKWLAHAKSVLESAISLLKINEESKQFYYQKGYDEGLKDGQVMDENGEPKKEKHICSDKLLLHNTGLDEEMNICRKCENIIPPKKGSLEKPFETIQDAVERGCVNSYIQPKEKKEIKDYKWQGEKGNVIPLDHGDFKEEKECLCGHPERKLTKDGWEFKFWATANINNLIIKKNEIIKVLNSLLHKEMK